MNQFCWSRADWLTRDCFSDSRSISAFLGSTDLRSIVKMYALEPAHTDIHSIHFIPKVNGIHHIARQQTDLYMLGIHDVHREVKGAQHYVAVSVAIMWRHLRCSLGGWAGSSISWSASWPRARLRGWRGRPLDKVYHFAFHIWDNRKPPFHI